MTKRVLCPDQICKKEIIIPDDAATGDIIECNNCGAEIEILCTSPLQTRLIIEEK